MPKRTPPGTRFRQTTGDDAGRVHFASASDDSTIFLCGATGVERYTLEFSGKRFEHENEFDALTDCPDCLRVARDTLSVLGLRVKLLEDR